MKKYIISAFLLVFVFLPAILVATTASAESSIQEGMNKVSQDGGLELQEGDPRETAATIINIALGFLGIIAVGMILLGGFKWMTAGGNDEAVTDARKIITQGIIGLAIILASWGIANFVLTELMEATGVTDSV